MKKNPTPCKYSWLHPFLEERPCSCGRGIFAHTAISQGTLLCLMGGHIMRLEEEPVFPDGQTDLSMQIHDSFVFGAKFLDEVEAADFFNHSCDPNSGFQGQIFLAAMRDIEAGEQVCFDYAMVVSVPDYRFECRCGSANCRGAVTGNDWKLPELQRRYAGYFQWYLEEKIRGFNGDKRREQW